MLHYFEHIQGSLKAIKTAIIIAVLLSLCHYLLLYYAKRLVETRFQCGTLSQLKSEHAFSAH